MDPIFDYFVTGFREALAKRPTCARRIGPELKFPLVNRDGSTVGRETVDALWEYLCARGWRPDVDAVTGKVVGARKPGEQNDTVASCETGYSKTEFSIAHAASLFDLQRSVAELRAELRGFSEQKDAYFLCHGIHPVTRPGKKLMMKKVRASVWDDVYPGNSHVPPEDGQNIHLFTVNSASHVHVSTSMEESVPLVNVLCGYAGAQIALTADSKVWRGEVDADHQCVAEKFWNWWIAEGHRVGVPQKPFADLADYVRTIASFTPVFVKREGIPYLLGDYASFAEYFAAAPARGRALDGGGIDLTPEATDIDVHNSCYWFNARLTRYYTVENRINDEQPADALLVPSAITFGLAEALGEATEALEARDWDLLRESREVACREAIHGTVRGVPVADLSGEMLELATTGLKRRGRGEEEFLAPLAERLAEKRCPAEEAAGIFSAGGGEALVEARRL